MFSEYASRFLAQSQSRIGFRMDETRRNRREGHSRPPGSSRRPASRSYMQRTLGDPYQQAASQVSQYPFHSRLSARPAPLFFSATDEFREEDDETEHEREIADFYALQRSRRHFGGSNLQESASDLEEAEQSSVRSDEDHSAEDDSSRPQRQGIRSSWRGEHRRRGLDSTSDAQRQDVRSPPDTTSQLGASRTAARLVDVGLDDTLRSGLTDIRERDDEHLDDPPSVLRFRDEAFTHKDSTATDPFFLRTASDEQRLLDGTVPQGPTGSSQGPIAHVSIDSSSHDTFWGHLFMICLAGLFATSFLIYLHTSSPSGDKSRWGDTIYMTLHKSFFLLGIYTLVSVLVSLLWLALLRFYVRPLVYVIMIAVPVILFSFSLYPFISSFNGFWHGHTVQDKVMRVGSAVPFLIGCAWVYNVIMARHAITKAVSILEFACRILAANPELLVFGLAVLACVVSWTWIWMLLFTRVFLGGHFASSRSFIIDLGSWWLGVYFVLVYLWSIGVIAGVQRAVTGATVSQWYFHRFAVSAPPSAQIVRAAVVHAVTSLFGTICLARLLALLIRLPFLLLPSRLTSMLSIFAYSLMPTPILALTNPLALTYASIHSQPLGVSARYLTQMTVLGPTADDAALHPRAFARSPGRSPSLHSYRLSKLILHATRFMMSLALGFGGWVSTARNLSTPGGKGTIHGSLYGYVVGLIAGMLGWSILGSMEGVIADIVDASIVCWSSEVGAYGREARYCREAGYLFGEDASAIRYPDHQSAV